MQNKKKQIEKKVGFVVNNSYLQNPLLFPVNWNIEYLVSFKFKAQVLIV